MNAYKKKICRLCLTPLIEAAVSRSLLDENGKNILESLTSIKVDANDSFPKFSCVKCWLNLKLAYKIQQTILEANKKLTSAFSNVFNAGNEPDKTEDHIQFRKSYETGEEGTEDKVPRQLQQNIEFIDESLGETENIYIKVENKLEYDSDCGGDIYTSQPDCEEQIKIENLTDTEVTLIYDDMQTEYNKSTASNVIHNCRICGLNLIESEYIDHIKSHYCSRVQCDICDTFCENIQAYHKHMVAKHQDSQKYWHCDFCQSTFLYKPLYKIHINKAHYLPSKTKKAPTEYHQCLNCGKRVKSEEKLLIHIKSHNKKECPICHIKITPTNFKKHVDAHSQAPVVCHLCGITYKNWTSLRSHIHYTHSTRTYMCKICKKVYKKSYDLLLHEKKEHTGTKDHICDICGKTFFTFYNLNKHKKMTHMKLRPHLCTYCKKRFSSKHALKTHERQHTNVTPYNCEVCGEGFRQNVSLKAHRKSKHNIVEPETCECKVCGKKFGSQFAIISHMRLH